MILSALRDLPVKQRAFVLKIIPRIMHYLTYHFLLTFLFITSAVFKADGQNSMVDMLGQEVYNAEVANAHQHEIRVSGLNTGMCFSRYPRMGV